ncbi:MAG: OmpH family outer membrane protein [Alistipes sp.]|jgi:Skp family chaperone for outer membrane proteins|nr:OmpH family outer membrane protein [Alistipes sp.]
MKKFMFAALALVALVGCNQTKSENAEAAKAEVAEKVNDTGLAYVRTEVMEQSDMFKTEGLALQSKNENTQQKLARKEQNLQNELASLYEKHQKGLITTLDAQRKERDIQQRVEKYREDAQKQLTELNEENVVFQNRLADLLERAVKAVNEKGQYKMIVNHTALLMADSLLDISNEVLLKANSIYKADKEAESKKK